MQDFPRTWRLVDERVRALAQRGLAPSLQNDGLTAVGFDTHLRLDSSDDERSRMAASSRALELRGRLRLAQQGYDYLDSSRDGTSKDGTDNEVPGRDPNSGVDPSSANGRFQSASVRLTAAIRQIEAEIEQLREELQDDPANVDVLTAMATRYRLLGHSDGALAALQSALLLEPGHVPGLVELGRTHLALGDVSTAHGTITNILAAQPSSIEALQLAAEAALLAGDAAAATGYLDRACELYVNASSPSAPGTPPLLCWRHREERARDAREPR